MTPRIVLVLLACNGCVLGDVDLGDDSSSTADADADSDADDSAPTGTTAPNDSMTGPVDPDTQGVGAPCDHGLPPSEVPESKLLTFPALDCEDLMCLYADVAVAPADPCESDVDCNASNPELGRFVCNDESRCELAADYVAEHSMCTRLCDVDADCGTDEPTTCQTGFSCAPQSSLGDACCRPVCVCNDDLDEATAHDLEEDCESGIAECCAVSPGLGLCPDD
jgi:hypothetical protein